MVDYVNHWKGRTEIPAKRILRWIGLYEATFYKWCRHYGKEHSHNGAIPRDHWIEDWERGAIIRFHFENPLDGYRRLAFMMLALESSRTMAPSSSARTSSSSFGSAG